MIFWLKSVRNSIISLCRRDREAERDRKAKRQQTHTRARHPMQKNTEGFEMAGTLTAQRKGGETWNTDRGDTLQRQQSTHVWRTAGNKWGGRLKTEESALVAGQKEQKKKRKSRDRWISSRNSSTHRQCEAVILREVGDAARGEIVQGEQGCCWLSKAETAS